MSWAEVKKINGDFSMPLDEYFKQRDKEDLIVQMMRNALMKSVNSRITLDLNEIGEQYGVNIKDIPTSVCLGMSSTLFVSISGLYIRGGERICSNAFSFTGPIYAYDIKVIEDYAFDRYKKGGGEHSPSTISFPNVEYIGDYIFGSNANFYGNYSGYYNVYRITIDLPKVKHIGKRAFGTSINNSTIFNLFAPNLEYIGDYAFSGHRSLNNVIISDNVSYIGSHAFDLCDNMQVINLANVEYIGDYAFGGCYKYTSSNRDIMNLNLSKLTHLGYCCLYGGWSVFSSSHLTPADFPNLEACDFHNLFYGYSSSKIIFEKYAGGMAGNTSITSVYGVNVKSIGWSAFTGCTKLNYVNLPNAEFVGSYAFSGCNSLTTLELPNVKKLGDQCFNSVSTLQLLRLDNYSEDLNLSSVGYNTNFSLVAPLAKTIIMSNCGVSQILSTDFSNANYICAGYCSKLLKVELGPNIQLSQNAFHHNSSLARVDIYASVLKSVPYGAFVYNPKLTTISFHGDVLSIEHNAFVYTSSNADASLDYLSKTIYFSGSTIPVLCTSDVTQMFGSGYFMQIFVPKSLWSAYKSSNYWSYYSSRIYSY